MDSDKGGRVLAVWVANRLSQHLPYYFGSDFFCLRGLPRAFLQLIRMIPILLSFFVVQALIQTRNYMYYELRKGWEGSRNAGMSCRGGCEPSPII